MPGRSLRPQLSPMLFQNAEICFAQKLNFATLRPCAGFA
ncbi:hypothetical protein [Polaromonas sp. CG9_12]|nr:hypothetical protein [Polaromonas sp. CG9_12]